MAASPPSGSRSSSTGSAMSLLLLLVLALLVQATAASASTSTINKPRFALFGPSSADSSISQKERVLQGQGRVGKQQQDRGTLGPVTAEDRKWDTGRFLRAVVDAQVAQVKWEVERVKAFIPPGIVSLDRKPEEVAEQVGKLIVDVGFGYVQSAALGYAFGSVGHLMADERTKKAYATRFGSKAAHLKGLKQAKQFGEFCAAFTAFEGIVHVARGVGDKWNGILGSTAVGVYTMRKRSWATRIQNGLTFGGFNYLLTSFGGGQPPAAEQGKGGKGGKKQQEEKGKGSKGKGDKAPVAAGRRW